ncbi:hypothetical protein CLCR_04988 [Cladophialophora carrionii]|uniref:Uncharacterized protein n=1 Tax=Cladophialophora carrionii TaxID=86049 RepID=A0A1C1CK65_9EURO|nr:hypothetical protein CLCR_04988 [Cladophialophora carrionii]
MAPTSQAQPQPVSTYLPSLLQGLNQPDLKDVNNNQPIALQPLSQFIPAHLPPGMLPFPPPPMATQPPNVFPPPMGFPLQQTQFQMPPIVRLSFLLRHQHKQRQDTSVKYVDVIDLHDTITSILSHLGRFQPRPSASNAGQKLRRAMTPAVPTATKNPGQDGTRLVDALDQINIGHGAKHNRGATIGTSTTDTRVTAQHHTRNPSRPARNQRHATWSDEGIGDRKLRVSKWSDKLADYDSHLLERIPIVIVEVTAAGELEIESLSTRRSGQHDPVQEDQLLVRGLFEDSTRIPSWGFHTLATHLRIIPAPLLRITRIINIEVIHLNVGHLHHGANRL